MKHFFYLFVLIVLLCQEACKRETTYYGNYLELFPYETTNDSNFILPDVGSIFANDDFFTVVSPKHCKFYVFDTTLTLISTYGNKGKGPKELLWPERVFMNDSITYIWDYLKKSIFFHKTKGQFLKEIKIQPSVNSSIFCVQDDYFYFHSMDSFPIVKINQKGHLHKAFGDFHSPSSTVSEKYFNNMILNILPYKDGIISVNAQHAEIIYYNCKGKILRKENFKHLESFFKQVTSHVLNTNKSKSQKFAIIHISDCVIDGERLFLLLTRSPREPKIYYANTLIVINLENNKIEHTIRLPGDIYNGLTVRNNKCLTYNFNKAQLELFIIPHYVYE